ncbi:hypothetical protein GGF37_002950 [Kickxella alabastrina]|nr:hypothetical protein GGF37_002950 [Kickxella alabastrina]
MEAVERLARIEALTEDILTDKQLLEEYGRKLQENSQALDKLAEAMKKVKPSSRMATTTVNMGDFFIQVPNTKAHTMVQGAHTELENAIGEVQQRLVKKVELLAQLKNMK